MAATHRPGPDAGSGRFPIDPSKPVEIVVHNRSGAITVRGVDREDILLRSDAADDGDLHDVLQIGFEDNRLEVRTDRYGRHAGKAAREASRAAREASREATRAAREASRATRDIFRRREGQFGKGPVTGSWQIDFDEHIRHELRDLLPFRGGGGSYDIEIEVPRAGVEVRIEAHTATGDVRVEDVHGAVDVATASGDLLLRRVGGDLTVQTASGEIAVAEPAGSLRVRSASGDVNVRDGSLEQVVVTTASGDISLATTLIGAGPYRIDAVSGDIDLRLDAPEHVLARGFAIPFKTVSGDGRVSGLRQVNRRLWRSGEGDDAGIEIALRTVSGDANVSLTRSDAAPAPARPHDLTIPLAAAPPTPTPARPHDATIPLPPVPPTPPQPPQPPAFATGTMPPAHVQDELASHATADDVANAAKDALTTQEWTFEAPEATRNGDALTRIADEMAASLAGPPPATFSSPPDAPVPADPSEPAATPAGDRLTILATLERGEIDIDEAMRRLDALPPTA